MTEQYNHAPNCNLKMNIDIFDNLKGNMAIMKTATFALVISTALLAGCTMKPQLIAGDEMDAFITKNAQSLVADQEPIKGPVGLYEAMARALKYNLDYRVEMINTTLAARAADVKSAAMLPSVVAGSSFAGRDPTAGGYSRSLSTGLKSGDASTSTQSQTLAADITASWNILDFGLSYVQAKQATDQALIAEEQKRKVVNRIVEDVRTAYWRAATAQSLLGGLQALEGKVNVALSNSRSLSREGSLAPMTALTYQRELVDIRKQIHQLELELRTAKTQLSALMNVAPGTNFTLIIPNHNGTRLKLNKSGEDLVEMAMQNRPELREKLLSERISAKEVQVAMLQLLPGIQVFGGANLDTNNLLYNSNWISWGCQGVLECHATV